MSIRMAIGAALPLCLFLAGGCVNSGVGAGPGLAPGASVQPASTAVSGGAPSTTPSSAAGVGAVASPSPIAAPATLDISPAEVRVGEMVMSLAFEPPRHMLDQAAFFKATNADPAQPTPTTLDGASQGSVVLNDMLRVTNNMDPSQPTPADSAQAIVRHVTVQVRTGDGSQALPYLGVSLDVLLDGHPVTFGQAVVPMVATEATTPRLYYGNNVRLAQRGTYQFFVRVSRTPLLGKDQPQAAQFNVLVH
jgi:hypothetical protein